MISVLDSGSSGPDSSSGRDSAVEGSAELKGGTRGLE